VLGCWVLGAGFTGPGWAWNHGRWQVAQQGRTGHGNGVHHPRGGMEGPTAGVQRPTAQRGPNL